MHYPIEQKLNTHITVITIKEFLQESYWMQVIKISIVNTKSEKLHKQPMMR